MRITAKDLIEARETTARLLDQLGLEAYVFEVEPRDGPWEVRVDCGYPGGWQSVTLHVDAEHLLGSATDENLRAQLLNDWRERLATCRYPGPGAD